MQDIRHALRLMRRQKAFTAAAVATLALGIGATTAIFSIVYGVLLRPLPYPAGDRIVRVYEEHPGAAGAVRSAMLSDYTLHAWRDAPGALDGIGAFRNHPYTLRDHGEGPSRIAGADLSAAVFDVLGARPAAGRFFEGADERAGAPGVVVLSWSLWQDHYGGSAAAIGRTVTLDGVSTTIVGVAPRDFYFPDRHARLWKPLAVGPSDPKRQTIGIYSVIGRLRPGVTPQQAAAEGTARARSAGPRPMSADLLFGKGGPVEVRIRRLRDHMTSRVRPALLLLAGAVAAVLLIACGNVANLLLARGVARRRELAVRAAVGAGAARLARQLITEAVVLSAAGGGLGLALGWAIVRTVPFVAPADFPRLADVTIDLTAVGFALLATLAAALLSSAIPVIRCARGSLLAGLRAAAAAGSAETRRAGSALLVAEAALALVLLVGAGLLAVSFARLLRVDPGFDLDHVLLARVYPEHDEMPPERAGAFVAALLERLRATPGVVAAGVGNMVPFQPTMAMANVRLEGTGPDGKPAFARSTFYAVTPGYAEALGLRLREGRTFREDDAVAGIRRVLINEHFARTHLNDGRPVAGRILPDWIADGPGIEIVGVVGNVLKDGLDTEPQPEIYHVRRPDSRVSLISIVVRTNGDPMAAIPHLRAIVRELEPAVALDDVAAINSRLSESVAQPRFAMAVLVAFAGVALALAAVGLYGVLSYQVSQRRREIGVRAALGASRASIMGLVLRQGLGVTLAGLALGALAAAWLSRLIEGLLFGVAPHDAIVFGAASAALTGVAILATLVPARRAASVDPIDALKYE